MKPTHLPFCRNQSLPKSNLEFCCKSSLQLFYQWEGVRLGVESITSPGLRLNAASPAPSGHRAGLAPPGEAQPPAPTETLAATVEPPNPPSPILARSLRSPWFRSEIGPAAMANELPPCPGSDSALHLQSALPLPGRRRTSGRERAAAVGGAGSGRRHLRSRGSQGRRGSPSPSAPVTESVCAEAAASATGEEGGTETPGPSHG